MLENLIDDAIGIDGLDEKWSIDGQALVEKLKSIGMIGQVALIDASERWWRRVANGEQPAYKELLD